MIEIQQGRIGRAGVGIQYIRGMLQDSRGHGEIMHLTDIAGWEDNGQRR